MTLLFDPINAILTLIGLTVLGLVIKSYFPSYFSQKGKNLATKEDVSEITDLIEKSKAKYTAEIEHLRSDLLKQTHVHKVKFEKEFQILEELWGALVKLRSATITLRPEVDVAGSKDPGVREGRLSQYGESATKLYEVVEKSKPFYPSEIYVAVSSILDLCHKEARGYARRSPQNDEKYWDKAVESAEKIRAGVDEICEVIRKRITS